MLQKFRATTTELFSNPTNVRVIVILSTVLLAALAGGAPSDHGGG